MGGGGARAAYQVGFLRALARLFPNLRIPYVTGVSAGAINAAHLASHHGTFLQSVQELTDLWERLTVQDVFRTDSRSLALNVLRWGKQLLSGAKPDKHVRSLVDTEPLRAYLTDVLHAVDGEITGIGYNISTGRLKAAAISTSSYTTGQSITWVQGKDIQTWERPQRRARQCVLTVDHVLASTALPLFFPAVRLEDGWHGDGSVRLTAPLSPALHLGAKRIIAISTRYAATYEEADRPEVRGYPPPAQVAGILMNSIFLDLLDNDALELERLNALLKTLPDTEWRGLRPVKLLVLRPSEDLGKLSSKYEPDLPRAIRFLTRSLGTQEISSPDFLSFILFQHDYLCTLMDLGEKDAMARADEIDAFIRGDDGPPTRPGTESA
ncbi:MAG: patatin [Gemmatimonadetes bacterium]|nr:patatin [Gemmatimonadota bacterium]